MPELDDVDLRLLEELERDADRPNVELARIVGLSPAATHKRVRRLKDEGVIQRDPRAARHERARASRCRCT